MTIQIRPMKAGYAYNILIRCSGPLFMHSVGKQTQPDLTSVDLYRLLWANSHSNF